MPPTRATPAVESASTLPLALQRARAAARVAAENGGKDILVLDTRKQTALFDYFVIATARSGRQLRAISDEIDHLLQDDFGDKRLGTEGYKDSRWIVLDFGDIVIQLFDDASRKYYQLDELWGDAQQVDISDILSAAR